MKKLLNFTSIVVVIVISILELSVSSCRKEVIKEVISRDTIIQRDTVTIIKKDTTLSVELLTAHGWKLQELRGVSGGSLVYYSRGGSNNTENFDDEYIIFKADKTGTYYDPFRYPSPLTWDFGNTENTKIVYTIQFPQPGPVVITWENVVYKNNSLKIDEYWTEGNVNSHTQSIRIPAVF
ncbi:hypothetical protein [Segetibacter koreensis]|uniref:hypothetical protein n=1 Tax=Segetibacter koreensis TaxID=398037 RepID=UPI0003A07D18|nr:hypothetical protein [Segetibacter koreensis]